jgi:PAS domain S-box-containing protein
MKLKLTLRHKAMIPMFLVLICEMVFGFSMVWLIVEAENQLDQERHAREVISHLQKFLSDQQSLPFYLLREIALPNEIGAAEAERCLADTRQELTEINKLVRAVPSQSVTVRKLDATLQKSNDLIVQCRTAPVWRKDPLLKIMWFARKLNEVTQESVDTANSLLDSYKGFEAAGLDRQRSLRLEVIAWLMFGILLNVVLAVSLTIGFTRNIVSRLERMAENSIRLALGETLYSPVSGDDEIAVLDERFHQMADALAEASFKERAIVDNARDVICTIDTHGVFLRINPAAKEILGRNPESMVGYRYWDFTTDEDRARTKTMFDGLIAGKQSDPIEFTMLRPEGNSVDLLLSAHWSKPDKAFFCVLHDITQRRQMERLKRQFLAMIAHDLRSPLTAIGGTLDLISAKVYNPDTEQGQQGIRAASMNIDRMLRLISDLLEMEKFDSANLSLEIARVNISLIIEEAVDSVSANAERLHVSLQKDVINQEIDADKLRMVQLLVNLLSNAIKYSPPNSIVAVTARVESAFMIVEVTDSGPGISAADKELIFEPYKQAKEQQGERRLEGTGLGLTICKSLVEAHHGSIGVVDAKPRGSIFWIKVPISQTH